MSKSVFWVRKAQASWKRGIHVFIVCSSMGACVANIGRHTAKLSEGPHAGVDVGSLLAQPKDKTDSTKTRFYSDVHFQYDHLFSNHWGISGRLNTGSSWLIGQYGSAIPTLDVLVQFPSTNRFYSGIGFNTLTHWGSYLIGTYYVTPSFFVTLSSGYDASPEFDWGVIRSEGDPLNGSLLNGKISLGWELPNKTQLIFWFSHQRYLTGQGPNLNPDTCLDFSGLGGWPSESENSGSGCPPHSDDHRTRLFLTGLSFQF